MKKNILIAMGAFKDVFSPAESRNFISDIILDTKKDIEISSVSLADGGEYSLRIIKENFECTEITVHDVINPFKKKVVSSYLILQDNTAFISSSKILRMTSEYDKYKNPLHLTSFGLGQLINDAVSRGIKKILIGLGGTGTIDAGIGMLQALGVTFLDNNNNILRPSDTKYFSGLDLVNIHSISCDHKELFRHVELTSLCDGTASLNKMEIPNNQKIGDIFESDRANILNIIEKGLMNYSSVVKKTRDENFYGVAGGINLSLEYLFNTKLQKGIDFFIDFLNVEEKIMKADLVITGEGKLDKSLEPKTPIGVSKLAKKYNKPVLYLVGNVSCEYKKLFTKNVASRLPLELQNNGIDTIISCHNYNENYMQCNNFSEIDLYQKNTPIIFRHEIREFLKNKGFID